VEVLRLSLAGADRRGVVPELVLVICTGTEGGNDVTEEDGNPLIFTGEVPGIGTKVF